MYRATIPSCDSVTLVPITDGRSVISLVKCALGRGEQENTTQQTAASVVASERECAID